MQLFSGVIESRLAFCNFPSFRQPPSNASAREPAHPARGFLCVNFQANVLNLSSPVSSMSSGRLIGLLPCFLCFSPAASSVSMRCQYLVEVFPTLNGIWGNFSPRHSPSPPSSFTSAWPALNSLTRPITFVIISAR